MGDHRAGGQVGRRGGLPLRPFLITECGIDLGLIGRGRKGWRSAGLSAEEYVRQLAWYNAELAQDDYVIGATVFGYGMYEEWSDFEVAGWPEFASFVKGGGWMAVEKPDFHRLGEYGRWSVARTENREDPRDMAAFVEHLRKLGAEYDKPASYGWPSLSEADGRTVEARRHLQQALELLGS